MHSNAERTATCQVFKFLCPELVVAKIESCYAVRKMTCLLFIIQRQQDVGQILPYAVTTYCPSKGHVMVFYIKSILDEVVLCSKVPGCS